MEVMLHCMLNSGDGAAPLTTAMLLMILSVPTSNPWLERLLFVARDDNMRIVATSTCIVLRATQNGRVKCLLNLAYYGINNDLREELMDRVAEQVFGRDHAHAPAMPYLQPTEIQKRPYLPHRCAVMAMQRSLLPLLEERYAVRLDKTVEVPPPDPRAVDWPATTGAYMDGFLVWRRSNPQYIPPAKDIVVVE
jgi:hypothetical protein